MELIIAVEMIVPVFNAGIILLLRLKPVYALFEGAAIVVIRGLPVVLPERRAAKRAWRPPRHFDNQANENGVPPEWYAERLISFCFL